MHRASSQPNPAAASPRIVQARVTNLDHLVERLIRSAVIIIRSEPAGIEMRWLFRVNQRASHGCEGRCREGGAKKELFLSICSRRRDRNE
jgi:hypothetical protein